MRSVEKTRFSLTVWGLALCQALLVTGNVLLIAVSPLIGAKLAPASAGSTLPVAAQLLGLTLATLPAGYLTAKWGRKITFVIGNLLGLSGVAICMFALVHSRFSLFVVGTFAIGVSIATGMLYRFAAVDLVEPERRDSALSLVMAGGVIAAFLGPWLAGYSRGWFETDFLGAFAGLAGFYGLAFTVLLLLRLPAPGGSGGDDPVAPRPLHQMLRQPILISAIFCAALGYTVMTLAMTATPLAMMHARHEFDLIADVIQWHMLAMFAPSFITGRLTRRFGHARMIAVGAGCLLASLLCALATPSPAGFGLGLFWLGLGWNFTFLPASAWLTTAYRPLEAPRIQAINDFTVFSLAALSALLAGPLNAWLGWQRLNLALIPLALLLLGLALWNAKCAQR